MRFLNKLSDSSQGIAYVILACLFASILIAMVRHLSKEFNIFFIVMVRNLFGLAFLLPGIIQSKCEIFRTEKLWLHVIRGLNGLASMTIWFYVITIMPLSEAVSVSFVIPIITTIAAIIFLKEKVTTKSWIAIFIGFTGILVILRPGFNQFHIGYFYSFISVILWSASNIMVKMITKTEKINTIVAYTSLVMLIASIPLAIPYIKPISFENLIWFAALGLVSNLVYVFISTSYSKADLSIVQPFDFTRLIFTAIISYFAFDEVIDIWVIIGSLIILCGVIIVAPRKNRKKTSVNLLES